LKKHEVQFLFFGLKMLLLPSPIYLISNSMTNLHEKFYADAEEDAQREGQRACPFSPKFCSVNIGHEA
jgi:hypothetical protein